MFVEVIDGVLCSELGGLLLGMDMELGVEDFDGF